MVGNSRIKECLMREVTSEEVERTIMEMEVGKSPGPDGFTTNFFQIVG
jgi:hypothetical protein